MPEEVPGDVGFISIEWHYSWGDQAGTSTTTRLRYDVASLGSRTKVPTDLPPQVEQRLRALANWGMARIQDPPATTLLRKVHHRKTSFDHLFVNVYGPSSHPRALTVATTVYRGTGSENDPIGEQGFDIGQLDAESLEAIELLRIDAIDSAIRLLGVELQDQDAAEACLPLMVYIAHRDTDDGKQVALELADALKADGILAWVDQRRMGVGDDINDLMKRGLARSSAAAVVFTPGFENGKTFQWEWEQLKARAQSIHYKIATVGVGVRWDKMWRMAKEDQNPLSEMLSSPGDPDRNDKYERVRRGLKGLAQQKGP